MPTRPSRTAVDTAAALRSEGLSKTRSTQVQGWIDKNWIPHEVIYPGGGGSEVRLGHDGYEIAALLSCLPRDQRNAENVVLARFIRGLDVSEAEIRPALGAMLDEIYAETGMDKVLGEDEDTVLDAADARAEQELARARRPKTLKAMEPGLRSWAKGQDDPEIAGMTNKELLFGFMSPLLAALGGQTSQLQAGMEHFVAGAGIRPMMEAASAPGFRPVDQMDNAAKKMMLVLEDWREVANDVSLDELDLARRVQIMIFSLTGQDETFQVVEGRVRREWGTLITSFCGACLAWVVILRHGLYNAEDLIENLKLAVDTSSVARVAAEGSENAAGN